MRARRLRFGVMLAATFGVVALVLALGASRDGEQAGAQGAVPTTAQTTATPAPGSLLGDAPGVRLATPTAAPTSTPPASSTPEISDDSHLGRTPTPPAPVLTGTVEAAPTPATPTTPTTAVTRATALPANPPTCTATTLGGSRAANAALAADCDALLLVETTLVGTGVFRRELNWAPGMAMTSWKGVTVGGTPKRVTKLSLNASRLAGAIPTQLGSLTALTELNLSRNRLSGAIPTQLGSLTSLTKLYLHGSGLSGAIPTQLGSLTALTELNLSWNRLSGAIPTQLGSLTKLTKLYLYGNWLTGAIPTQLGSLTKLRHLYLYANRLTGSIPPQLGRLTALETLELSGNRLTGAIPTQLGSLTKLRTLALSGNTLTGCVPNALAEVATQDLARASVSFCPAPAPELMVLADGVAGVLILEWTSTARGVTRWQYRTRGPMWHRTGRETWSAWTNIPGSSATTQSYRLTGLTAYRGYDLELRAVTPSGPGTASATETRITLQIGSDGIPSITPNQPTMGGRTYRISLLAYVIDVPATMRIVVSGGTISWSGIFSVRVTDTVGGDYFVMDGNTGNIFENSRSTASGSSGNAMIPSTPFEQMVSSLRRVEVPIP